MGHSKSTYALKGGMGILKSVKGGGGSPKSVRALMKFSYADYFRSILNEYNYDYTYKFQ